MRLRATLLALFFAAPFASLAVFDLRPNDLPPPLRFWQWSKGRLAFFEFAPANGAGLPYSQDLCSAASALISGQSEYWCTSGNGAGLAGSTNPVVTLQGSPTFTDRVVCPNGPDCATKPAMRITSDTIGITESANVDRSASRTTGSFTACTEFIYGSLSTQFVWQGLGSTFSGGGFEYLLKQAAATNTFSAAVSTSSCVGAASTQMNGTIAMVNGGHYLGCLTWQAGDGTYRLYLNGVADVTSTLNTTICGGASASRHSLGGSWVSGALVQASSPGQTLGGFYTSATSGNAGQLSPAQISTLTDQVLARVPTGAKGEAFSAFVRAGTRGCTNSAGLGGQVTANSPCITSGGFGEAKAVTVDTIRNEELNNAAWTATAAVTADQALAPNGILSADQLNDSSGVASQGVVTAAAVGGASLTKHTVQAWVAAGTSTKATLTMTGVGNSAGDCTVTNSAIPSSGVLLSCTSASAYAAGLTGVLVTLNVGAVAADTGTILVSFIDHADNQLGPFPHVPTIGSSVTTTADPGLSLTLPAAVGPTACIAASASVYGVASTVLEPLTLGSGAGADMTVYRNGSDLSIGFQINGTSTTSAVSSMGTTVHRWLLSDNAGTRSAFFDGVSKTAPGATMGSAQTAVKIGADFAGGSICDNCVISRIQIDNTLSFCSAL